MSADPDLGYYSPPPGVQAHDVDRPYEYVSASTVPSAHPSGTDAPVAYAEASYPTPAYAVPDGLSSARPMQPLPGPAFPLRDARPKGVSITSLVLAIIGLVLAFVPAMAGFAVIVMIVAFIVSITALASAKRGGKGFAGTALALSILGGLVAVVVAVLQAFGAFGTSDSYSSYDSYDEYEQYEQYDDPVDHGFAAPGTDGIPADDMVLAAPVPLTVVETAFGGETGADSTWVVVILDNPNPDHIFVDAEVRVRALDAAGTEVATAYGDVTALQGRSAVVLHGVATDAATVASVEVTVPDAASATVSPAAETGAFSVTDARRSADDKNGTEVSGMLAGRFENDQSYARVAVVARDAGGRIVGAQTTYVDRVAGDGTPADFRAWFTPGLPTEASFETYPTP
ncbi:hypothetical protein JNB62_17290 [Microbacterium jejuense]|uniref:DUF4190 domain-containing protein n=1 Tax=Microbacterium jejuense TaxID=1263637 RepID=A0ABS7HTV0_9MICO|nr:hypothetical protein [Microbacterium jejuense]MBW9095439.1 hypothetical protein [Microbacterium jejuense]